MANTKLKASRGTTATGTPSASTFLRGDNAWGEAGAAAGQVIQVLGATDSTRRTGSSTSFITLSNTLSVSITPSSASNKILIIVSGSGNGTNGRAVWTTIFRNSTNLGTSGGMISTSAGESGVANGYGAFTCAFLDSPSTTSAITYQPYFKCETSDTFAINSNSGDLAMLSSITCMEIKG
jgi:hypothetical protein